ncbi:MAG: hypothetical protein U5K28_10085 [Halobacteriales archaeon]|nr:hypothetical protein [Halobacteriales archaeon]
MTLFRRIEQTVGSVTRDSRLYRWLTAEPDPTVITIDLRETYTIGPILALLEWLSEPLVSWWEQSTVQKKTVEIENRGHRIIESSRVATWLGRLFVPPEPPDGENQ